MSDLDKDIEVVKDLIEYSQNMINDMEYEKPVEITIHKEDIQSMLNVLSEFQALREFSAETVIRNAELQEENEDLNNQYDDLFDSLNDCIDKQVVRDMIEYLDSQQRQWSEDRELKASDSEIIFARDFLKELIGE